MTPLYDDFARVLDYPTAELPAHAAACRDALAERHPEAAAAIGRFADWAAARPSPHELEELYIRTFEMQARCCLEVGWHLFGESYKRGALLVKLRVAARAHDVAEGSELPDHIATTLRLLARLGDDEDPRGLAEEVLVPAADKMVAVLGGDSPSPWRDVIAGLCTALRADFAIAEPAPPPAHGFVHLPMYENQPAPYNQFDRMGDYHSGPTADGLDEVGP